jgi:hypothetical protein
MLSACLNACTSLHIAEETHYFDDLRPRLNKLRELHGPEEFGEIVENYFLALSHRLYGQAGDPERGKIQRDELRSLATDLGGTPDHVFEAFCRISARNKGKQIWGEKTPRHVFRIDEILDRYPQAKIVCMIRDGRAVVASYRDFKKGTIEEHEEDPGRKEALEAEQKRVRKSYHVIIASLLWRGVARATQKASESHGKDQVYALRYEDLVADAPMELGKLTEWIGLEMDAEKLSTIPIGTSSYADKVQPDAGVSTEAVQRWRKKMSDPEVHTVEATSAEQLEYFSYELLKPRITLWQKMKPWLTLPAASITAMRANSGRHGGIGSFVLRRLKALR